MGGINIYNSIYPLNPISSVSVAMVFFAFATWIIIRWSFEKNLEVIKEYKSLMNPLGELSLKDSKSSIHILQVDELKNKNKTLLHCWQDNYDQKSNDIDARYKKLNDEMDKIIKNPYRLLSRNRNLTNPNTTSSLIAKDFKELYEDTENLYDQFKKMIRDEKIELDTGKISTIKKAFDEFIFPLRLARNKYSEIKNQFIRDYSNPFEDFTH